MKILFSPIGTADPLTTLGDGPMLHIVRHYQPDKVILFLSPKMAGYQDKDGRYTDAIERLCDLTGQAEPTIGFVRSPRPDVHHFDAYIADFESEMKKLRKEYKSSAILVNVSSGTPAMEQALVALGAFGEYDITLLQVATPRKDTNESCDRENQDDYDFEALWELYSDNEIEGEQSRIEEVALPSFKDRIVRENILSLIDAYDYEAASVLAAKSPSISVSALSKIYRARDELNLILQTSNDKERLRAHLWVLEVRMKQGHWADFVRSLTPAYTYTAEFELEKCGLPKSRYLKNGSDTELDEVKVDSDGKLCKILGPAVRGSSPHYISNKYLSGLVEAYCSSDVAQRLRPVRDIERKWRNKLAHDIVPASKREIEAKSHTTFESVTQTLFELNHMDRGHYDDLNKQIRGLL